MTRTEANKRARHCETVFSLDFETTSYFMNEQGIHQQFDYEKPPEYYKSLHKYSIAYIWMLSIHDIVFYGRELSELHSFITQISKDLGKQDAIIYIHNLAFDFQFLRNIFNFDELFARDSRKPLYAHIEGTNFTLKCSFMLSNCSLSKIAEDLKLDTQKLTGNLDYNIFRHPYTKLNEDELKYCENDCLIIYHYIEYMKGIYGSIHDIPLTSTSRVRKLFKEHLLEKGSLTYRDWKRDVAELTPDFKTFQLLIQAYSGGYTHSNATHTGKVLNDIHSIDFTSSYPAVMILEKYPMTPFIRCNVKTLEDMNTEDYAYLLKVKMKNVLCTSAMTYISSSKCTFLYKPSIDNGRVLYANELEITITEQDLELICETYSYSSLEIIEAYESVKTFLPKPLIEFVIKMYGDKCYWKGVCNTLEDELKTHTHEYEVACENLRIYKAFLNSIYGMCVTNNISDIIKYDGGTWDIQLLTEKDIIEELQLQEEKQRNLLPYQWGVWITAYARRNLWNGIQAIGEDVIYSDTDSIKYMNNHDEYIKMYNEWIHQKLNYMASITGVEGIDKAVGIGEFDTDAEYSEFATLGAKKYAYRKRKTGKLGITISGVNKKTGVKALNDDINNFNTDLLFNYIHAGKLSKYYHDDQPEHIVNDGVTSYINNSKYGISLVPTEYNLGITEDYFSLCVKQSHGCSLIKKMSGGI